MVFYTFFIPMNILTIVVAASIWFFEHPDWV